MNTPLCPLPNELALSFWPVGSVPMLCCTLLPVAPLPVIRTPLAVLPLMMLRVPVCVPHDRVVFPAADIHAVTAVAKQQAVQADADVIARHHVAVAVRSVFAVLSCRR